MKSFELPQTSPEKITLSAGGMASEVFKFPRPTCFEVMDEEHLKIQVGLQGEEVLVVIRQREPHPMTPSKNIQMPIDMFRKLVYYSFNVEHASAVLLDSMNISS